MLLFFFCFIHFIFFIFYLINFIFIYIYFYFIFWVAFDAWWCCAHAWHTNACLSCSINILYVSPFSFLLRNFFLVYRPYGFSNLYFRLLHITSGPTWRLVMTYAYVTHDVRRNDATRPNTSWRPCRWWAFVAEWSFKWQTKAVFLIDSTLPCPHVGRFYGVLAPFCI